MTDLSAYEVTGSNNPNKQWSVTRHNAFIAALETAIDAVTGGTAQPLDSDLTAIAALTTTTFGRSLLTLADAAAARTALELGSAATSDTGDFATAAHDHDADYQPLDSDLTAIAALTTTAFGRAFLAMADEAATLTALGMTSYVQSLLDAANGSAMRTKLGLVIGTNVQAYGADLAALDALNGTNTIYYRSGADTWSPVTIGENISFSGGELSVSSGPVLLETLTPSAAATSESTAFAGLGYREVLFVYELTVSNDDASILVRWRIGGSIISAASYFRAGSGRTSSGTASNNDATTGIGGLLNLSGANFGIGNASTEGCDGELRLFDPDDTARYKNAKVHGNYTNPNGSLVDINGSFSYHGGTGAIEGAEFSATAGTITGTIKVYGIK